MNPDAKLFAVPDGLAIDVPHLVEYFGPWCIYEPSIRAVVERCNGLNLAAHIKSAEAQQTVAAQNAVAYDTTADGIAIISISGPMMKMASSMSGGTSTVRVRQQLRAARKDTNVVGAMLVMDTPGGTVKGNKDLADEVAAFAAVKPIYAYVEDLTASAGVSVASQATERFANNPTALYGSMGTYAVLVDQSGEADKLGVKVHVVKAGEFKGTGEPGTVVTEQQLAETQRIVDSLNEGYLQLIASGLKKPIEQIRALADGRIHPASEALKMGLIDGIQTFEQSYQQLVAMAASKPTKPTGRTQAMNPATLAELKSTFPNSTAEWRESQLEANATISDAAIGYAKHIEAKAAAAEAAHATALAEAKAQVKGAAAAAGGALGHQPITAKGRGGKAPPRSAELFELDADQTGDAIEDFNAAVARVAGRHPDLARRQQSIRTVAAQNPDLYKAYLLACNPGKKQTRMIEEKYETAQ